MSLLVQLLIMSCVWNSRTCSYISRAIFGGTVHTLTDTPWQWHVKAVLILNKCSFKLHFQNEVFMWTERSTGGLSWKDALCKAPLTPLTPIRSKHWRTSSPLWILPVQCVYCIVLYFLRVIRTVADRCKSISRSKTFGLGEANNWCNYINPTVPKHMKMEKQFSPTWLHICTIYKTFTILTQHALHQPHVANAGTLIMLLPLFSSNWFIFASILKPQEMCWAVVTGLYINKLYINIYCSLLDD